MRKHVFHRLIVGLVLTLGMTGAAVLSAPAPALASTATPVVGVKYQGGPGHETTVYAFIWELDGKRGPCIDFNLVTPDSTAGTRVITQVPGMTAEQSARAMTLVQKYRDTRSSVTAAALALSVWHLRADSGFKTWYRWAKSHDVVPKAMVKRVKKMLKLSKSHAPFKMELDLTPVLDGRTGTGTVTVVNSAGKPARGIAIKVGRTTKGAKLLSKPGNTNKHGVAKFKFKRLNNKKVGFRASSTAPSVNKALLSRPSAGRQRLLVGGFSQTFVANAEYSSVAGKPTISTVCDTDCDGQATLEISYHNPKKSGPVRWILKDGTTTVLVLDVKSGSTGTASARVTDGQVLTFKYCALRKGACSAKPVELGKKYEVVCPAWAAALLVIPCSCDPTEQGSVTFTSPLGSPRYYKGYVTIGDGTVEFELDLVNGEAATVSIGRIKAGTTIVVSFTAYRNATHTVELAHETLQSVTVN